MPVKITVPALGESVTEAMIAQWFVKQGDHVAKDQPLCEIESDKVNVELPAPVGGVLTAILKHAGDTVAVGELVGELEPGEGFAAGAKPAEAGGKRPEVVPPPAPQAASTDEVRMGPAAKRLVTENQLDASAVPATGPGGRLTKGDVLAHLDQAEAAKAGPVRKDAGEELRAAAPTTPQPAAKPAAGERGQREERVKLTPLRRKVAERLVHAQQTAAILTTFNEVDMGAVMELRARYQEKFQAKFGIKLGFMSFFVKASIEALKAFPGVNAEMTADEVIYKHYYDIGVAVGGGKGLVVPVIRDADRLSFAELEQTIANLGKKARDNKLTMDDLSGGTFTISNGGIYGSMMSTPILNPPQTGILGMHNIVERPMAIKGQVVIRPMMYLALSYDHRVIDGREAVSFLVRVKELIEQPERILLEV